MIDLARKRQGLDVFRRDLNACWMARLAIG